MRLVVVAAGFHRVRVLGRQHMPASPRDAPVVVMAPHSSFFDAIAIVCLGAPSVVAKADTARLPFIGRRSLGNLRCEQQDCSKTIEIGQRCRYSHSLTTHTVVNAFDVGRRRRAVTRSSARLKSSVWARLEVATRVARFPSCSPPVVHSFHYCMYGLLYCGTAVRELFSRDVIGAESSPLPPCEMYHRRRPSLVTRASCFT